jgi:hypothetical protein
LSGGVADDEGVGGYILCYYASGTDEGVVCEMCPTNDYGIGTDGYTVVQPGREVFTFTIYC